MSYDEDHPLSKPEALVVPVLYECLPDADHPLTTEEIYDAWASILEDSPYPLIVSGYMLVDKVRLVEGIIAGHISGSGDPKGPFKEDRWIDMSGHCVQRITGISPTKGQLAGMHYNPVMQFRCFWCGSAETYTTEQLARVAGWKTLIDPLNNNIDFCPCTECQDKMLEYMEMFNNCN